MIDEISSKIRNEKKRIFANPDQLSNFTSCKLKDTQIIVN